MRFQNINNKQKKRLIMKKIKNINLNPVTNSLAQEYVFVDNELQESLKKVNL